MGAAGLSWAFTLPCTAFVAFDLDGADAATGAELAGVAGGGQLLVVIGAAHEAVGRLD